ncbi:mucosal addressin cell adhesion molecule 1 isoform X1 [Ahaetulla prasina]|uniref:mucosal addressin cell adhesion molecule 1 isoform X1 n=1 Tax=Ahaetulla prasina TaxID=499056 RepID=UPI0026494A90|nr:mucosal addressin cell adhesion molecule 1 isoform X1 [Ahaetulla prasina]
MAMISFAFLLSLVCYGCSLPTSKPAIRPLKPLVERGGTIQLICSMDCPGAEVQWEGLDIDLGDIISNHTQSVLTLSNATISTEGTKMCSGQCQGRPSQAKVELKVYSFPDTLQLDFQPKLLHVGQPARLLCSMSHVYPHGALTLTWFQGDEQLEASKETEEEEMGDSEDQLFVYHSELELPRVAEDVTYKCKATLEVEEEVFVHERVAITITGPKSTQELLSVTKSIALTPTSGRISQTSAPELLTTANWKSSAGITTSLLGLVSSKHNSSGTSVVTPTAASTLKSLTEGPNSITVGNNSTSYPIGNPLAELGTTSPKFETWSRHHARFHLQMSLGLGLSAKFRFVLLVPFLTDRELSAKPLSTTEGATERPTTTKPVSTANGFLTEGATEKTKDPCRPTIVPVPAQGTLGGALRITCQTAKCSRDVQIQWVETPLAQSQYRLEEAEGRSTLMVERVSLEHQGVYRCIAIASPPRIATVRIVVSADVVNTDALFTIGATGSLFGLIITGYIAHRWRQRHRW